MSRTPTVNETECPTPPRANGGDVLDPDFSAACIVCRSNEPCCLRSGVLKDYAEPSRKLEWPVTSENSITKMLVVAKNESDGLLEGKLLLEGEGDTCCTGRNDRPGFSINSPVLGRFNVSYGPEDIRVGYNATVNWAMALQEFIPEQFLLGLLVADSVVSGAAMLQGGRWTTITPVQCISDTGMRPALEVKPVPYFELSGDATAAVGIHFLTTGIGGTASLNGGLSGKYAMWDIAAAASTAATPSSGRSAPSQGNAPGFVGTLASIISNFSEYVSQSSPSPNRTVDRTAFGSGVRFDKALRLAATGIKLEEKRGSPDLEAKIGSLETSLTLTASGTLDFVDIAANVMLSPAGARLVQETRAAIANEENAVRGEIRCEVAVSAEGELKHKVESGLSILIPAVGDTVYDSESMNKEFGGRLTVRGQAQVLIHVEGEVWIASAEAGVAGTLHTGWNWEMKVGDDRKRKKRYYFEGLIARATGYMRVGARSSARRGPAATNTADTRTSQSVATTQQGPSASLGDSNWRSPNAERSELDNQGKRYVLLQPTVERISDSTPPWQDY